MPRDDGRLRPARIAEVIRQLDADIIALQEVLSMEGEEGGLDQARFFANELGLHCAMGENRRLRGGGYGNVVLSRFPVRSSRNYDVSVPGRERRGCLRTDLELTNGQIIHLFNVHLGTAFLERRHQARKLLEEELLRSRNVEGPRVVLGDFNEWTKGLVTQMLKAEFQSADLRLHLHAHAHLSGLSAVHAPRSHLLRQGSGPRCNPPAPHTDGDGGVRSFAAGGGVRGILKSCVPESQRDRAGD